MSTGEWRLNMSWDGAGKPFWWLLSGNHRTLGRIYSEKAAKEIVAAHNQREEKQ